MQIEDELISGPEVTGTIEQLGADERQAASRKRAARRERERPNRKLTEEFVRSSRNANAPCSEEFLLDLHNVTIAGSGAGEAEGYRSSRVVVKWKRKVVYRPPGPESVPSLMNGVFDFLSRLDSSPDIDPYAEVYLRMMKIHPFRQGNGRTARALVTYLLLKNGYAQFRGRSLESYIDANTEEYYDCLYRSRIDDPGVWIPFFRRAVRATFLSPSDGAVGRLANRLERALRCS